MVLAKEDERNKIIDQVIASAVSPFQLSLYDF
jgi:hypothetical protein